MFYSLNEICFVKLSLLYIMKITKNIIIFIISLLILVCLFLWYDINTVSYENFALSNNLSVLKLLATDTSGDIYELSNFRTEYDIYNCSICRIMYKLPSATEKIGKCNQILYLPLLNLQNCYIGISGTFNTLVYTIYDPQLKNFISWRTIILPNNILDDIKTNSMKFQSIYTFKNMLYISLYQPSKVLNGKTSLYACEMLNGNISININGGRIFNASLLKGKAIPTFSYLTPKNPKKVMNIVDTNDRIKLLGIDESNHFVWGNNSGGMYSDFKLIDTKKSNFISLTNFNNQFIILLKEDAIYLNMITISSNNVTISNSLNMAQVNNTQNLSSITLFH